MITSIYRYWAVCVVVKTHIIIPSHHLSCHTPLLSGLYCLHVHRNVHMQLLCLSHAQETIWVDTEEAWPVPLPPVVTMVMLLHRLATSISRLDHTHQTATDHTPDMIHAESVEAIGVCNQLAVSVLGILKTSEGGKALSAQVQMHAQLMAQAGKTINHLLKKGLFRTDTELTL